MSRAPRRPDLAGVGRRLHAEGLLKGTSGNLSVREVDTMWITPSGVPWPELDATDLARVRLGDGERLEGPAPSSEAPLHRRLYRLRDDIRAIVHTHSHFATVFSVLRRPIEPVHYLIAFGGRRIGVADYACYGTDALADRVAEALGDDRCVLLANHGLVAVGETLARAAAVASAVEEVAALQYHAEALGEPVHLDDAQLRTVEERLGSYGPQD